MAGVSQNPECPCAAVHATTPCTRLGLCSQCCRRPLRRCAQQTAAGSYLAQNPTADGFKLVVTSQFYVPAVDTKGFLTVALPELELTQQQELAFTGSALNASELNKVEVKSEFAIAAGSVQLWWPAGGNYGPHKLYDVDISYAPDGHTCAAPATAPAPEQPAAAEQQPDKPIIRVQQPGSVAHLESSVADSEFDEPISPDEAVAALEFADVDQREAQQLLASKQQRRHLLAQDAVKQILPADAAAVAAAAAAADADAAPSAAASVEQQAAPAAADAPASAPQQNKGQVVAAAAIKGLLGAVASTIMERQAAGSAAAKNAAAANSPQCSSIRKRIGFRTIELVMQPLPQAVQELFGSKRGFDFEVPNQKIHAILGREGGGQWANNEDGVWTNFPGDDVEVCVTLCCAVLCCLICCSRLSRQGPGLACAASPARDQCTLHVWYQPYCTMPLLVLCCCCFARLMVPHLRASISRSMVCLSS